MDHSQAAQIIHLLTDLRNGFWTLLFIGWCMLLFKNMGRKE